MKLYLLGLEREEEHEDHPGEEYHDYHIWNHMFHPHCKAYLIAGALEGAEGYGVRRGSDGSSHASEVGGDRYRQGERHTAGLIVGQRLEHGGQEGQHHGGGGRIAHEHREQADHQQEAEEHELGVLAKKAQKDLGQLGVHAVLGGDDSEHESSEEEHDHGIGERSHDALVVDQSAVLRIAEHAHALVRDGEQHHDDDNEGRGPVGNDLEHPHERREHEDRYHALLDYGKSVDAEETDRDRPEEYRDCQHDGQQHTIFDRKLAV